MEHSQALKIAKGLVAGLSPECVRIEIAGSVRRGKADVHDIELVVVPKMTADLDMFGTVRGYSSDLDYTLDEMADRGSFRYVKNGLRFKQLALPEGINVDLFLVHPPAQWGVIYLIRTGPAEFSHWMVTQKSRGGALPDKCFVKDGCVWGEDDTGEWPEAQLIPMPEEADFFTLCGMEYIEPCKREARWGARP